MFTTVITADGQTQIPDAIQYLLNLQPGDRINFIVAKDGKVYLQPTAINVRGEHPTFLPNLFTLTLNPSPWMGEGLENRLAPLLP